MDSLQILLERVMAQLSKKEQTKQRIIEAAGKGIREHGYAGIGVDGVAKAAGVTSGAIYGNFGSKGKVFEATVSAGMKAFVDGVHTWQNSEGEGWILPFIDWYLSRDRRDNLAEGCALPGLSADVARANREVHQAYEEQLNALVSAVAQGLIGVKTERREQLAWALLSTLAGTVLMSRAVDDPALADQIAQAGSVTAKQLVASALTSETDLD